MMLATWGLCAGLILSHHRAEREYITVLDQLGLRDAPVASTPLRQVIPARHADAQMWSQHALAAAEAGDLRLRFTHADNAPHGREMHWSSGLLWLLRAGATVQGILTGQTGPPALERSLLWLNAPLFLAVVVLLSAWTARRAGAAAGVLMALAMVGHNRFYEAFAPANVDHHGLVNAAALGLVLGLLFMGAGWWQPPTTPPPHLLPTGRAPARRAAIASGCCGAIGLWLSAASIVPFIAIAGLAGLAVTWWLGDRVRREGAVFDPTLWQWWGRVGAAGSLAFYLLEYAPSHFGWRLEVNHPWYALAWWGGAEFVARLAAWRLARSERPAAAVRFPLLALSGALLAVLVVPATMLLAGRAVFLVSDPFVGGLRHFVAEGRSLATAIGQSGFEAARLELLLCLLLVPGLVATWRGRGADRLVAGLLALMLAVFAIMWVIEVRWGRSASAVHLVFGLVLVARALSLVKPGQRRWLVIATAALLFAPAYQRIGVVRTENAAGRVAAGDLLQPLYRDIAAVLRASQPEGNIILLASPNASAGIGYFGRFQTLGTLFWENAAGLRAAAEIFSAHSDDEALARLRARRVTHLAFVATANFLGEYYRLLHPGADLAAARQSFGFRLASGQPAPRWLQPIPYRPPSDVPAADPRVRLFKVVPDQTEGEQLYHTALAQLAAGETAAAEKSLEAAATRAAPAGRAALLGSGGLACYDHGADAVALRLLRRSLALANDPAIAVTVSWILA
ncbi:MAG: hypothetical protein FJ399_01695, partial [Verrucomicrobia bacterium]|nr:hypothetical protein [Verrucomicrobiota bacterium]